MSAKEMRDRPLGEGRLDEVSTRGKGVAMSEQRETIARRVEGSVARFNTRPDVREWVT